MTELLENSEIPNSREIKIDSILSYCHYSLNNTTLYEEIPYYKERGIGVINASSLSMGLLTKHGAPEWHPAPKEIKGKEWSEIPSNEIKRFLQIIDSFPNTGNFFCAISTSFTKLKTDFYCDRYLQEGGRLCIFKRRRNGKAST